MKTNKLNALTPKRLSYSRNSKSTFKKFFFLSILLSSVLFLNKVNAQEASETVYKDWLFVAESKNHVDVSARIVKCSEASAKQVHLFIFNEGSESSDIKFIVTITDVEGGNSFNTEVKHKVERAEMVRANCDNNKALNDLKISLPENYNPNNIKISITFN